MKQIIYIAGYFPPPATGQAIATQHLADLLQQACDVRCFNLRGAAAGVETHAPLRLRTVRHALHVRRQLAAALAAAPEATVLWPAVSPTPFGHLRDLLTVLPAFRPDQDVYAVIHRGDFDRVFRTPWTAPTARWMVRRLHGFVFLNEPLAARCAPWIPDAKRFAIPNTIDAALHCTDAEVAAAQERRMQRPSLRLLFLSNMIPSKGYLDVLHAVQVLRQRGVAAHAHFVGHWPLEAERLVFEQRVAALELRADVVHHGSIHDRARLKQLYLEADALLLPTYYPTEAQPLSIIEALNAGTPVVTTRHAGIPDMVREDHEALFVPPRDPAALADAVERLQDLAVWKRLSDGARHRFLSRFSPEAVRRQWERLIAPERKARARG